MLSREKNGVGINGLHREMAHFVGSFPLSGCEVQAREFENLAATVACRYRSKIGCRARYRNGGIALARSGAVPCPADNWLASLSTGVKRENLGWSPCGVFENSNHRAAYLHGGSEDKRPESQRRNETGRALLRRIKRDVFVYVGCQRRTRLHFNILPVLDQSDRSKQHRQSNGGSFFAFALFALAAT